jgi:hypothetical protein
MNTVTCFRVLLVLTCLVGLLTGSPAWTQPAKVPQPPTLKPIFPFGIRRGTTLDLTLTGTELAEPTGVWTSFPARVSIPSTGNNGKEPSKLAIRIDVPGDAPVGFHGLRLATRHGISNLVLFCIDDLPQVVETSTNHTKDKAQAVPVPCTIVGRADAEVTDFFRITVAAGQRLSFEVLGRRLGSTFDPLLTLYDPRTGKELPGGHDTGAPGRQTDPCLTYTFAGAGDYLVAVRDVSYKGGADYHYRLRIGDFPCATTPMPMAVTRGESKTSISFAGRNVEGVDAQEVTVPADATADVLALAPRRSDGVCGWPVYLTVSNLPEILEREPNDSPGQAQRITLPVGISGRFAIRGDRDYFLFAARKGEKYTIEAHTAEHGSPSEVYLTVRDKTGKQLLASDPNKAPRLTFTAPAEGDYLVVVEHLLYWGGPAETYRLTIDSGKFGFQLSLTSDRFRIPQGGTTSIPVLVTRAGYTGPIEVRVVGAAGVSGKATVPAGQPKKDGTVGVNLPVQVAEDAMVGPVSFHIEGRAVVAGQPVITHATVRALRSKDLANLPLPPPSLDTQLGLAITEKAPFTVQATLASPSVKRGKGVPFTVQVTRSAGFTGPITLVATGLPANVSAKLTPIAEGANEGKGEVKTSGKAPPGSYPVTVVGVASHQGKTYSARAAAVALKITK